MIGNKLKQMFGGHHTPGLGGMSPSGLGMGVWPKMASMNPVTSHSGMIVQPPKGLGKVPPGRKLKQAF